LVIVVLLVSATRRPTVLYAHYDRDGRPAFGRPAFGRPAFGRPATAGPRSAGPRRRPRRTSGRQPVSPHGLPVATPELTRQAAAIPPAVSRRQTLHLDLADLVRGRALDRLPRDPVRRAVGFGHFRL